MPRKNEQARTGDALEAQGAALVPAPWLVVALPTPSRSTNASMLTRPLFETTAIVSGNASLAAQLSSLFTRTGRYLPVLDGPRMTRPDATNEVVRRRNALVMARPERVLLAGIAEDGREPMKQGWRNCISSDDFEVLAHGLRENAPNSEPVLASQVEPDKHQPPGWSGPTRASPTDV